MKQFLSACLAVLLLAVLLVLPAAAEETTDALNLTPGFSVTAEAAYVANTDTGLVVYEKNSETPMAAASLTKLMTMILMLESYQDQLDTISITAPGYIYDYLYGKNASTADIWKGETHTQPCRHPAERGAEPPQPALRHDAAQRQRGSVYRGRLYERQQH